jgi:hypothetical protein
MVPNVVTKSQSMFDTFNTFMRVSAWPVSHVMQLANRCQSLTAAAVEQLELQASSCTVLGQQI